MGNVPVMKEIPIDTPVRFIGFPSYMKGCKGKVVAVSERYKDLVDVEFTNGKKMWTDTYNLEEIVNGV